MRRLFSPVLAAFLAAVLTVPAFADDDVAEPPRSSRPAGIAELEQDHTFFEIEVTIADWKREQPAAAPQPDDDPPRLHGLTPNVAEEVRSLIRSGRLINVQTLRLMAAEGQSASVQTGGEQPRIVGAQAGPRGLSHSINYQTFGSQIAVVPRQLQDKRVAVDFSLGRTGLASPADALVVPESAAGPQVKADTRQTLTIKTIAVVPEGETAIISGLSDAQAGCLVLLSVRRQK